MEAMAAGLPVVASRLSGIPELVTDGVSGLLVPPADPVALADALQRLAGDPELRARLGDAGRATVLRDFDVDRNAAVLAARFAASPDRPDPERAAA
jgi:glycosyltransferase involved in cell wall biosynthesis